MEGGVARLKPGLSYDRIAALLANVTAKVNFVAPYVLRAAVERLWPGGDGLLLGISRVSVGAVPLCRPRHLLLCCRRRRWCT